MIYVDEHDREQTQRTLGELIATSLTSDASAQTPNV
jgi:hypothetical protein